jgi:hypothetical protein
MYFESDGSRRFEMMRRFQSFDEFYDRLYLKGHRDVNCRRFHVAGIVAALAALVAGIWSQTWLLLLAAPVLGYGLSWVGHYLFEKNHPTVFRHPLYSFVGDWRMTWDMLCGRLAGLWPRRLKPVPVPRETRPITRHH